MFECSSIDTRNKKINNKYETKRYFTKIEPERPFEKRTCGREKNTNFIYGLDHYANEKKRFPNTSCSSPHHWRNFSNIIYVEPKKSDTLEDTYIDPKDFMEKGEKTYRFGYSFWVFKTKKSKNTCGIKSKYSQIYWPRHYPQTRSHKNCGVYSSKMHFIDGEMFFEESFKKYDSKKGGTRKNGMKKQNYKKICHFFYG